MHSHISDKRYVCNDSIIILVSLRNVGMKAKVIQAE